MRTAIIGGIILVLGLTTLVGVRDLASGTPDVCPEGGDWTEHMLGSYTAPDGYEIVEVCVKAGSAQSGGGTHFYSPPAGTTSIAEPTHPSGHATSHYSVRLARIPEVTTSTSTSTSTTAPTAPPTSTTPATTTTTSTTSSSTTSSVPGSTTTVPPSATTTTSPPTVTTTTAPPTATTTTTLPGSTTTTTTTTPVRPCLDQSCLPATL